MMIINNHHHMIINSSPMKHGHNRINQERRWVTGFMKLLKGKSLLL